jgi:hypothetical protein
LLEAEMSDLRSQIQDVVEQFVSSIYNVVRASSLSELVAESGAAPRRGPGRPPKASIPVVDGKPRPSAGGRRKRASSEEVERLKETVLVAAKQLKPGFSKSDVMRKSRSKVDLGRALALVVADGKLTKKGDRRLTRYWMK